MRRRLPSNVLFLERWGWEAVEFPRKVSLEERGQHLTDDDDDDGDDDDDDQEEGVRRRVGSISLAGITGPEELELLEEEAHCESEVIFFLFFYLSLMILKL